LNQTINAFLKETLKVIYRNPTMTGAVLQALGHQNKAARKRAEQCIQCGVCEAKCPQGIPISRWMPVIHRVLGESEAYVMQL
jgi:predicted aldo/keto reductase-like oxidoreductase